MKRFTQRCLVSMLAGLVGLLSLGLAPSAQAIEILHWRRLPLAIPLVVGQERVIFVDRNVRVGVPASVGDHLRVQSADGAIYLRANAPLPPTRLQLQDVTSGALILVDIDAAPAKAGEPRLEPVRIVTDDTSIPPSDNPSANSASTNDSEATKTSPPRDTPVPVVLTRYAAQNLYAPLRTVEPVAGIARVTVRRDLALDTLLTTLPVQARVLAAWRLEDDWVTAVQLTNTAAHWLDLDPRLLQGDFVAATFQHPNLGPAGQSTDTTVVYLVTRGHGLAASLLPVMAPFNAAANLPKVTATPGQGARHAQ